MGRNGCDGSQASGPWAIGSGYRFNPPFSQLANVPTTIALEGATVIPCTPDWGTTEYAYWRRLLDRTAAGRTELSNGPVYVTQGSHETMPAPEWDSFLSIVDGSLNTVPVSDLNQVLFKELMAEKRRLYPPGSQEEIRVLFGHY